RASRCASKRVRSLGVTASSVIDSEVGRGDVDVEEIDATGELQRTGLAAVKARPSGERAGRQPCGRRGLDRLDFPAGPGGTEKFGVPIELGAAGRPCQRESLGCGGLPLFAALDIRVPA